MNYGIEKIVTASGRTFAVGSQPFETGHGVISNEEVMEINPTVGDPVIGFGAGHVVMLSSGRKIEISNAVEVWYASERIVVGGDE